MSKILLEYKIAYAEGIREGDDSGSTVLELLNKGWDPYGSPVVVTIDDTDFIKQAMVFYEEG